MINLKKINFNLNGESVTAEIGVSLTLAEMLRSHFKLTGTKICCGEGECGACTVLLNQKAVNSCIILAAEVDDCEVITIEYLGKDGKLDPIQEAFVEEGAIQCGYCTPGMIMSSKGLLIENPNPSDDEIKDALSGNICRCTGYDTIISAVKKASGWISEGEKNE